MIRVVSVGTVVFDVVVAIVGCVVVGGRLDALLALFFSCVSDDNDGVVLVVSLVIWFKQCVLSAMRSSRGFVGLPHSLNGPWRKRPLVDGSHMQYVGGFLDRPCRGGINSEAG